MIDRYSLNPQPADKLGEYCERLPIGEVTELQDMLNCNTCDENSETWLDSDPYVFEFAEVDIETFFFPSEMR